MFSKNGYNGIFVKKQLCRSH